MNTQHDLNRTEPVEDFLECEDMVYFVAQIADTVSGSTVHVIVD